MRNDRIEKAGQLHIATPTAKLNLATFSIAHPIHTFAVFVGSQQNQVTLAPGHHAGENVLKVLLDLDNAKKKKETVAKLSES